MAKNLCKLYQQRGLATGNTQVKKLNVKKTKHSIKKWAISEQYSKKERLVSIGKGVQSH